MKDYKRLTNNNLEEYDPEYDFCVGCKYFGEPNGCNRPNGTCDDYERFNETYNRLAELEDKIESSELISKKEVERLQNENAALRERLEKAVELPSGDRVWFITEDEEGKESYIISKPTDRLTVDELYEIGKKCFTTREACLSELKGEKK